MVMQRVPLADVHFRRISQLIYQHAGIVLADHKREMVDIIEDSDSQFVAVADVGERSGDG